ncbi:MAG: CDP-diacylglycerol--serine O-phosphatidyltransferase [Clostridium sp.]
MRKSCIPNIFTFINLACGILSILATFEGKGEFVLSGLLIIIAGLVDRYDGRIARYLQVSSELGKELDSLADLVSFGVAPSILVYKLFDLQNLGPSGLIGIAILITFPICGAFRLARYNTSSFDGVFTGVPITIAGSFMALFAIISVYVAIPVLVPSVLMILFSYLMVSNFKLKKV